MRSISRRASRLALALGGGLRAHLGDAVGEVVADALELLEAEQARAGVRDARGPGGQARIGGDDGGAEVALEVRDLRAQRAPRGALVDVR